MLSVITRCAVALTIGLAPAAHAQSAPDIEPKDDPDTIVVTGYSSRGTVRGNIAAELEFDAADIAAYGTSSIDKLLEALGPSVASGRGRGAGGRPIVLINGQRISGFREIRDLPPEAIERVQVFPEELALKYGYRPDQRVINFILVPNFRSISAELEHGESRAGGYGVSEIESTLTRMADSGRLNIDVELETASALTEAERGIVQPRTADAGLADDGEFRSLIAETDRLEINASWSRMLSQTTSLSLSGEYQHQTSHDTLGLADVDFFIPADSPFSRAPDAENIYRFLPAAGALQRDVAQDSLSAGITVNGLLSDWAWTLTGNYSRDETRTKTDRAPDTGALTAAISAGDPAVDPFDPALGAAILLDRDSARGLSQSADATLTASASPLSLPAGEVSVSVTAGFEWLAIDSRATRNGLTTTSDPDRTRTFARTNVDIPLTSDLNDVLAALGDLSVNASAGHAELSDFGGLSEYGFGLTWEPVESVTLIASVIGEEVAPSVQDLGGPVIVTPNVSTFDFQRGESVLIDRTSGGNADLAAESRRDLKLSASYAPGGSRETRLSIEYLRNRSEDVTRSFPALTPEIEAAFPDRVVRGADGRLLAIDARSVTFSKVRSDLLRTGFDTGGRFPAKEESPPARADRANKANAGSKEKESAAADADTQPEQRDPKASLRRQPESSRGGWRLSLYHSWRLAETVEIRPGIAELDLLDGAIADGRVPLAEHEVELSGSVFLDGFGVRASAQYTGEARIDSGESLAADSLRFGDIFTMDLRAFYSFDSAPGLVRDFPILAGSRVSLDIENLFGGIRRVENGAGVVPLSFQPGYLNAQGRFVELSFRKRF